MKVSTIIVGCLLFLTVLITIYATFHRQTWSDSSASYEGTEMLQDELHGGLLAVNFDERSCLSRYKSFSYRKVSPYIPSSYLLSRLRNYEDLHKRCGPHTKAYNESVKNIEKFGHEIDSSTECKYIVWVSSDGLGNRILTIASAFLYALLTNRVLLVDQADQTHDLFCEPFPETSWLLPLDFPVLNESHGYTRTSTNYYGNIIKKNGPNLSTKSLPSYMYLYLKHDYDDYDKAFFCDQDQALLGNVPWLIVQNNNYIVPSMFLMPSFKEELIKLFPETETVFHHLGRYLFHASNPVWGRITRYYHAYLAKADKKMGIQIRNFVDSGPETFDYVMDQVMACTSNEKLLPQVTDNTTKPSEKSKSIAVLVTSLAPGYFENLKEMYLDKATATGEVIGFHQASHEEVQQSEKQMHNIKAFTEMFLLSFTDVLVTSGCSTFGYVSQGLGGLTPWIMYIPRDRKAPNPPCQRSMSMEPCFLAPPFLDCKTRKRIRVEDEKLVPHVRICEDRTWGIKVVHKNTF